MLTETAPAAALNNLCEFFLCEFLTMAAGDIEFSEPLPAETVRAAAFR